jgi:predicted nucleic acid-binding protein
MRPKNLSAYITHTTNEYNLLLFHLCMPVPIGSLPFPMKIINGNAEGYFSVITEAELLSGARNDKEKTSIYYVLDVLEAIDVDRKIAVTAGNLRRKYIAYGAQLPDSLIAATAKEN